MVAYQYNPANFLPPTKNMRSGRNQRFLHLISTIFSIRSSGALVNPRSNAENLRCSNALQFQYCSRNAATLSSFPRSLAVSYSGRRVKITPSGSGSGSQPGAAAGSAGAADPAGRVGATYSQNPAQVSRNESCCLLKAAPDHLIRILRPRSPSSAKGRNSPASSALRMAAFKGSRRSSTNSSGIASGGSVIVKG